MGVVLLLVDRELLRSHSASEEDPVVTDALESLRRVHVLRVSGASPGYESVPSDHFTASYCSFYPNSSPLISYLPGNRLDLRCQSDLCLFCSLRLVLHFVHLHSTFRHFWAYDRPCQTDASARLHQFLVHDCPRDVEQCSGHPSSSLS